MEIKLKRQHLQGILTQWLIQAIGRIPLWCHPFLAWFIGCWLWVIPNDTQKTTYTNVRYCFPEQSRMERIRFVLKSLIHQVQMMISFCALWTRPHAVSKSWIARVEGEVLLDNALKEEKGLLLLLPHLGNWELVNHYLVQKTHVHALYRPAKIAAIESLIFQGRTLAETSMYPTNLMGIRKLYQALKKAKTAVILPDQQPESKGGLFVPFFNIPAYTGVLTAKLIQETQPNCLAIFAIREANGQYTIHLRPVHPEIYQSSLEQSLTALNRTVEACILLHPEQYLWGYKRFKKRPIEGTPFY
jgi:Kdo2-lipid IVA lauroyltransferase/acyltransferase